MSFFLLTSLPDYVILYMKVRRERVMVRVGCFVRHLQEGELGTGRVVALRRGANIALVIWEGGVQRRHDLRCLTRCPA